MIQALAAAVLAVTPPAVCVRVEADARAHATPVAVEDFVSALRARISRRHLRVARCVSADDSRWRLSVLRDGQKLVLQLDGEAPEEWLLEFDAAGLSGPDLVSALALKAAEALRPSIDAVLESWGLLPDSEREQAKADSVAQVERLASPEATVTAIDVPAVPPAAAGWRWEIELQAGVGFGVAAGDLAPRGALAFGLKREEWRGTVVVGGRMPRSLVRSEVTVSAAELELAGGVDWRRAAFEVGASGGARWTRVLVGSESPTIEVGPRAWWSALLAVRLGWWPLTVGHLSGGFVAQAVAVFPTREFALRGEAMLVQSWIEGRALLGVRVWL